jgi:microcin C transport system ATP-binding protein
MHLIQGEHINLNKENKLLEIKNLNIGFRKAGAINKVVNGIDLTIYQGETVALVGESGSGKSVTAQSILRLIPETQIAYPEGEIIFENQDILKMNENGLVNIRGHKIGMIFQEPLSSLNPLHIVEKQINEVLMLHQGFSYSKASAITLEWLVKVGINDPEKKIKSYPHQLSGGERQRVMIAMALANKPSLLIADEPTTALDVTIQAQILKILKNLQIELGMSMLFITHNLGIVKRIADKIAVMYQGKIVETKDTMKLFKNPENPYTIKLLSSEPDNIPLKADIDSKSIIEIHNLKIWFPVQRGFFKQAKGYIKAVDDIDLHIKKGQTIGVVGESGSGKTTLGKAIIHLQESTGEIIFNGSNLNNLKEKFIRPFRREMQMIFQDPYGSLSPRMSIEEIIREGLDIHKIGSPSERKEMIIDTLNEVGLDTDILNRYPNEFSGGQRQRIAIARALVLKPQFIVLDEPTSSLDRSIQFQVIDLLKDLQKNHELTYMFISHDLKVVKSISHYVIIMKEGKIVESGTSAEIFLNPQKPYTKELLETAFDI